MWRICISKFFILPFFILPSISISVPVLVSVQHSFPYSPALCSYLERFYSYRLTFEPLQRLTKTKLLVCPFAAWTSTIPGPTELELSFVTHSPYALRFGMML